MANEKRLIDPKKALYLAEHSGLYDFDLSALETLLFDEPCITVDAVEVVHARWCYEGLNAVCSNCGLKWFDGCQECGVCPSDVNYCPHCGAKMDLEDKE